MSGHGRGTNLQAILDACASGTVPAKVAVVIGTREDAPAMERATAAGVPVLAISPKRFEGNDEAYASAILEELEERKVGLVCLAGYMRMLPEAIVNRYKHAVMNVHPALLPLFGGKGMYGEHVHRAVLESGMKVTGCTVHFVDYEYDTGPIIHQQCVRVLEDDTPETLAARVLPKEHAAYVEAIQLFAEGSIRVEERRVRILSRSADIAS